MTQVLKLTRPIEVGKKQVDELRFRDYTTAEDYLAFDVYGQVGAAIRLIASVTGEDEALIKRLSGKDYRAAKAMVDKMLEADAADDAAAAPQEASEAGLTVPQKKP